MNERRDPGQGLFVTVTPGNQKFREFVSARFVHTLGLQDQAGAKSGKNLSHQEGIGRALPWDRRRLACTRAPQVQVRYSRFALVSSRAACGSSERMFRL